MQSVVCHAQSAKGPPRGTAPFRCHVDHGAGFSTAEADVRNCRWAGRKDWHQVVPWTAKAVRNSPRERVRLGMETSLPRLIPSPQPHQRKARRDEMITYKSPHFM